MAKRDIIVVGGSAGSTEPLKRMLSDLPRDFPAAIFVTTHIPSTRVSFLPELLGQITDLRVAAATDGQPIEHGRVYLPTTDRHLLLIDSTVRLGMGPHENMSRPAIDPMFRSAALSFGPRAVGVILSGMLNDGASGLYSIKAAGGTAIVQHPVDAKADGMPRAALEAADIDYVAPAADLSDVLTRVVALDAEPARPTPDSLIFEVEVAAGWRSGSELLARFAEPAPITCPDCGGVLSEVRGQRPLRFRCQIGHAYTAEELAAHGGKVDEAIRVALRRVELVERMARDARSTGRRAVAELYEHRGDEYRRYAGTLREAAILSLHTSREVQDEAS